MSNPTRPDRTTEKASTSTELSPYTSFSPFAVMHEMLEQLELAVPRVDITHEGEQMYIQIDLPGISPEDIEVTIDEYSLELEGERHNRTYRRFQRVIPLPQHVDPETAEAQFENGVLEIKVRTPTHQRRGRRLEIRRASEQSPT